VDRGWLGSQAFAFALAFNANIGTWNTASVSNMAWVCAAFPARRRAPDRALTMR
jgi:surface protein